MLFQGCLVETLMFNCLYAPDNRLTHCTANVLEKIGPVTGSRVHPGCLVGSVLFIFLALYVVLYFACLCSVTYAQNVRFSVMSARNQLSLLVRPQLITNVTSYTCVKNISDNQVGLRYSKFSLLFVYTYMCFYSMLDETTNTHHLPRQKQVRQQFY